MFDHELGGVKVPRSIIDQQNGPECGPEAVENVIQLVHLLKNDVSERDLKARAATAGHVVWHNGELYLAVTGYQPLLNAYGIRSSWTPFDWRTLTLALRQNRVAIAIVNPHRLEPESYREEGDLHAIVITNFGVDANRKIIRVTGIDSNFGGTERHWSARRFRSAVVASGYHLLITDNPIAPLYWGTYDILTQSWEGVRFVPSPTP
jgi:hypothetical protein